MALRIDFISDVVCPWCVVGLRSLEVALRRIGDAADVELHFEPFELNPDMGPEGEDVREHVARKYGAAPERSDAVRQAIKQHGALLGFEFGDRPDGRIWNSFDAHRLLCWAQTQASQHALKQELFSAYFTEGRNISDRGVLVELAESVGLDRAQARAVLEGDDFAAEVRAIEQKWRDNGIHAVPTIILNQRWMIQGAQPPEVFEEALRRVLAGTARPA